LRLYWRRSSPFTYVSYFTITYVIKTLLVAVASVQWYIIN